MTEGVLEGDGIAATMALPGGDWMAMSAETDSETAFDDHYMRMVITFDTGS